jgi:hypothetical protein
MQTSIKDIIKRIYIQILLMIAALYVMLSVMIDFPDSLLEAITFLIVFVTVILMYKFYPKYSNKVCIVTPRDRQILEISMYSYIGTFIFQTVLNENQLPGLKIFSGFVLLCISAFAMFTLYKIIKK